jgi:hypothetical protein
MKKLLFAIVACSLFQTASAQRYEYGEPIAVKGGGGSVPGKVRFGVFFAPTMSWMKPTSNKSDDKLYIVNSEGSKAGFTWGLMADYFFEENYGITTGFQVTNGGGKIATTFNYNVPFPATNYIVKETYFDYKLQYLEIPFGLKLCSDELTGGVRLFGNLGVAAAFNISKKADYEVTYMEQISPGNNIDKTVTGEKEKIQGLGITPILMNLTVGGGIEYPLSEKLSLYTGLFFTNGFAPNVTNPKEYDLDYKGKFDDANTRLNNFALRIGLFF